MFRKHVNKSRSAKSFRKNVGKTAAMNLRVNRGGFRM